jgi:hypothetical protein
MSDFPKNLGGWKNGRNWRKHVKDLCGLGQQASRISIPMIELEGNIDNQSIVILNDSGASHSYINSNIVEIFHL